jgi:hypothetical protein
MSPRIRSLKDRSSVPTKRKEAAIGKKTSSDMGAALSEIVSSSPVSKRPAAKRIYDVGSLRIPLERAENMQGKRGESARRYKEILDRMSSGSRQMSSDPDRYDPPRRETRPVLERPPGRSQRFSSLNGDGGCRSDDNDDDDDDDCER